ncbi:hypothetical protein F443_03375 [Phytophthora nicotianae P1569]|uniref:Uncharacterized protein n=1 Tax=Phytophthora nicotianae P1569 TaxID=1317065 RepID=V9FQJ0_PHYNI|nr:hypothetical protein F443_03375 [Phytophthora nicotianae P1569]
MNTSSFFESEMPRLSAIFEFLDTLDIDFTNSESANEMKHLEAKTLPKKPTRTIINHERERVPYSTGLQRRKRAETRKLRIEAKVLTAQLAQLKRRRQEHIKNASALSSGIQRQHMINWRSVAAVACEQRQIAERINCELKAIMADQDSVRSSVLQVLVKTNAINEKDVNFLRNTKPRPDSTLPTELLRGDNGGAGEQAKKSL